MPPTTTTTTAINTTTNTNDNNDITDEGAEALARNPEGPVFNLNWNNFSDEGANALAKNVSPGQPPYSSRYDIKKLIPEDEIIKFRKTTSKLLKYYNKCSFDDTNADLSYSEKICNYIDRLITLLDIIDNNTILSEKDFIEFKRILNLFSTYKK